MRSRCADMERSFLVGVPCGCGDGNAIASPGPVSGVRAGGGCVVLRGNQRGKLTFFPEERARGGGGLGTRAPGRIRTCAHGSGGHCSIP